jgi:hypothetical protein
MKPILLLIAALFGGICQAQNLASTSTTVTLTSAAEVFTLQQPSNPTRNIHPLSINVSCAGTGTVSFTLEINGSQATNTANPVAAIAPIVNFTPSALAFDNSNVGIGTVIGKYTIGTQNVISLDVSGINWAAVSNKNYNLTLRTANVTTTISITIVWQEI